MGYSTGDAVFTDHVVDDTGLHIDQKINLTGKGGQRLILTQSTAWFVRWAGCVILTKCVHACVRPEGYFTSVFRVLTAAQIQNDARMPLLFVFEAIELHRIAER